MTSFSGYALIIGVGSYRLTPARNVPATAGDAEAVAQVLRDPQRCGYPTEQVTVLTQEHATTDAVLAALDTLARKVTPNDTVFVFYAGHGDYGDDGAYYLTTHDTQIVGRQVVNRSGVRQDVLLEKIKAIPAERMLLVFNACHAGAAAPGTLGDDGPETGSSIPEPVAGALLSAGKGRIIITACRANQKSYFVRDAPTTIFGQKLVASLNGEDIPPRQGAIGVFDLYGAVHDSVKSLVQRKYELVQEPELTVSKGVGVMAVARYQGNEAPADLSSGDRPAPGKLGGVVRELAEDESRQLYEQVVNLQIGQIGDRFSGQGAKGNIVGGNLIQAGRDYVGGDKISVGNITGSSGVAIGMGARSVVNINQKPTYFDTPEAGGAPVFTLEYVLKQVNMMQEQFHNTGLGPIARELQRIAEDLEVAQNDPTLRTRMRRRAQRDLDDLLTQEPGLQQLASLLRQVPE